MFLAEKGPRVGAGGVTSSADLVHSGACPAASIDDDLNAVRMGQACRQGAERILSLARAAVVADAAPTVLLIEDPRRAERALDRWRGLGLSVTEIGQSRAMASIGLDTLAIQPGTRCFETDDAPFCWRLFVAMLRDSLLQLGVRTRTSATVVHRSDGECVLETPYGTEAVEFDHAIHATGCFARESLASHRVALDEVPAIRLRRSLSLVAPRMTRAAFLYADPGRPSVVPNGADVMIRISGLDIDAAGVDLTPCADQCERFASALQHIGLSASALRDAGADYRASMRVTIDDGPHTSLEQPVVARFLSRRDLLLLPREPTAAPVAAELALEMIAAGCEHLASDVRMAS